MNRIRKCRQNKKLTLKQLSEELAKNDFKISADALGKYERGKREPKLETWVKLADYFNVPVGYLMGTSDDKFGWKEWAKATGYSEKQLQDEVQRLIDTGRLNKDDDEQHQIGQAVKSLDFDSMDTTQGVLHELNFQIIQLKNAVSDAFLDPATTQHAGMSFEERLKHQHPKVRDDMDANAYHSICKILDETRYKLAKIPIKDIYNH